VPNILGHSYTISERREKQTPLSEAFGAITYNDGQYPQKVSGLLQYKKVSPLQLLQNMF
jgi:hypothetical protein